MPATTRQINLLCGWPSPDVLPAGLLSTACQRVLGQADPSAHASILQYGPNTGHEPLRQGLARWLGRHYGVEPDPQRICITGGASQSLAGILQSFTDPNYTRAVWLVSPCYHLACGIFTDAGLAGKLRAAAEDDEGVDLEALATKIRQVDQQSKAQPPQQPCKDPGPFRKLYRHVIYLSPTCSNPTGKTMPLQRRQDLVRLARECDALIVSDDVYDFLQWPLEGDVTPHRPDEMRLPRLCDIDLAMGPPPTPSDDTSHSKWFGNAVSNGSFSKIVGPGVRTGWVEASPTFVEGLGETASTISGGAPSQLCAAILGDMVLRGDLEEHIETKLRPSLQRRHRLMMEAIGKFLAPLGVQTRRGCLSGGGGEVYGGYFVWLKIPSDDFFPANLVADAAMEEQNLIVGYGNMFEVHGDKTGPRLDSGIRLCFSWVAEEDLVEGVRKLGVVLERMRDNREYYTARHKVRGEDHSVRPGGAWESG